MAALEIPGIFLQVKKGIGPVTLDGKLRTMVSSPIVPVLASLQGGLLSQERTMHYKTRWEDLVSVGYGKDGCIKEVIGYFNKETRPNRTTQNFLDSLRVYGLSEVSKNPK
jgi:hypothetical protein